MKKILKILIPSLLVTVFLVGALFAELALAQNCSNPVTIEEQIQCGANNAAGGSSAAPETTLNNTIAGVVDILTFIVGAVAVIMIIYGGYLYTTSAGDPGKISTAKKAFVYAAIGIAIAAAAQAITQFVISEV